MRQMQNGAPQKAPNTIGLMGVWQRPTSLSTLQTKNDPRRRSAMRQMRNGAPQKAPNKIGQAALSCTRAQEHKTYSYLPIVTPLSALSDRVLTVLL